MSATQGDFVIHRIRFDRFEVSPDSRQLLRDGAPVALGARAFDLLVHLIKHRERVVSKNELMDAVWPGVVVIENNLNAQVAALRKLLGTQAILTVTGRGFRFGFELSDCGTAPVAAASERSSIAVLPFQNLSGGLEDNYFADGMAEDVLTALSRFRQLVVIARNSSFTFRGRSVDLRQVGRELGARYVLEGSVRKFGQRLRLTGQLIDTRDGSHIWAEKFEGDVADVFDLQDRMTAQVVAAIEPAIRRVEIEEARRKRPDSLDAYDLYLRALPHLYAMKLADNDVARDLLEQAIALDARYAPALVNLAWCYEQRLSRMWPGTDESHRAIADDLARRALAEAGDDANVTGIAGFVLLMVSQEYEAGLAALRRATAANPHNALNLNFAGTAELFAGDLDRSLLYLERAHRYSPSDPAAFMFLTAQAGAHFLAGRHVLAKQVANESVAINPDWDFTWMVLAAACAMLGETQRAREAVTNIRRVLPHASVSHPIFLVFRDSERRLRMQSALRTAGLPE